MTSLPIYDRSGAEVGKYEVDPAELAPRISKQLMHDVVVMYQANLRLGTVKTKGRSEVAGTTKKMYRQKGTGNARAGSRTSGIRRGGGDIHPRVPRDWSYRLTKKAIRLATRMAMASKITENQVMLIDKLSFAQPKTKEMAGILKALKINGESLLVAVDGYDVNVYKSICNIANVSVLPVAELNALSVLRPRSAAYDNRRLGRLSQQGRGETNSIKYAGCMKCTSCTMKASNLVRFTQSLTRCDTRNSAMARDITKTKLALEPSQIIFRPLVTEKGMHKANRNNAYAFEVNRLAGKDDIRRAVEELFDVKVLHVNTQNRKGKPRKTRFRSGQTKAWKKAVVTLDKEHRINFF